MASTESTQKRAPDDTSIQVSLITPEPDEAQLTESIKKLERFLRVFGFAQWSTLTTALSWLGFTLLGVLVPLLLAFYSFCSDCQKYQIRHFELQILFSQAIVAAISLLCVSHNLRKYGVRKLLFVDRYHEHMSKLSHLYVQKINGFFSKLVVWVSFCFLLKTAREVTRIIYLHPNTWWHAIAIVLASLVSWTYSTILYLSGTALFNLIGNLQVIHFENYGMLLERDLDVSVYVEEHMHLKYHLSKISHRFRIFLLLEFLVVTASQIAALLQTTENMGIINFINAGDFAVLSIAQLVGIVLCLNAASKISHRAQGLGSVASRWHALVTCNSNDSSHSRISTNGGNLETANARGSLPISYSESDLESTEYVPMPTNVQLTSHVSYNKRQAFVTYVQSNTGGFTIFGWLVDRMLINTVFFIEMSLVFFVLGKTITVTLR